MQQRTHRLLPRASNRLVFYQALILAWVLERDVTGAGESLVDDFATIPPSDSMRGGVGAPGTCADDVRSVCRLSKMAEAGRLPRPALKR